jgi:hypothetical protein
LSAKTLSPLPESSEEEEQQDVADGKVHHLLQNYQTDKKNYITRL